MISIRRCRGFMRNCACPSTEARSPHPRPLSRRERGARPKRRRRPTPTLRKGIEMHTSSAVIKPFALDEADAPLDGWDDPVKGRIRWRTLFSKGGTPTDGITCGVCDLGPGDWLGLHRHAPPEIYYVFAGAGLVTLDGREVAVKAGSAVFIPGMAEHASGRPARSACGSSTASRSIRLTRSSTCSRRPLPPDCQSEGEWPMSIHRGVGRRGLDDRLGRYGLDLPCSPPVISLLTPNYRPVTGLFGARC
jgi:mannose-6-phosphate isomerase-like protein (cupin superfamily)